MTGWSAAPPFRGEQLQWAPVSEGRWLLGYLAATALLGTISVALMTLDINQPLFFFLNRAGEAVPGPVWQWLTFLGDTHMAVIVAFLFALRWPQVLWAAIFAALLGSVVSQGFKEILDIPRPAGILDLADFRVIGEAHKKYAYPSGHTLTVFTLAGAILPFLQRAGMQAALLAVVTLAGLSRIMVGVHWPADVLAGAGLGLLCGLGGLAIARRWPAGLRPKVHITLAALFTAAAAALFWRDGGYPAAIWLARATALAALASAGLWYWYPLLRRGA